MLHRNVEPLSEDDFCAYMAALGSISPPVMTDIQLVSTLATILQNYCDPEDADTMERLTEAAVDTVIGYAADVALDFSVGPEDGVN